MDKYDDWELPELVKATAGRGLNVTSTARRGRAPKKEDHISALVEADAAWTFRFMDLPPELRVRIYDKLLIMHEVWTCSPQILATCKQINAEASEILYRQNLFEIKIDRNAHVKARGVRCDVPDAGYVGDLIALHWPDFLRRAQWVKCSVEVGSGVGAFRPYVPHNTLYSLCSFLQDHHSLVSLELESPVYMHLVQLQGQTEKLLQPLQLLGEITRTVITSPSGSATLMNQIPRFGEELSGGILNYVILAVQEARVYAYFLPRLRTLQQQGFVLQSKVDTVSAILRQHDRVCRDLRYAGWCDMAWERTLATETDLLVTRLDDVIAEDLEHLMNGDTQRALEQVRAGRIEKGQKRSVEARAAADKLRGCSIM